MTRMEQAREAAALYVTTPGLAEAIRAGALDNQPIVKATLLASEMERDMFAAWLREQSDEGADIALSKDKPSTARSAYGGGSLALKRAADALARNPHHKETNDGD